MFSESHEDAGVQELVLRFVDGTDLEAIRRFAQEMITGSDLR